MNLTHGSGLLGKRLWAIALSASLLGATGTVAAQDIAAAPYDEAVLNLLLESRSRKPASQASAQERATAMEELNDIYLVSGLPETAELSKSPMIKAQLELQEKIILFNAFATDFLANNPASEQEIFDAYQEQYGLAPPREFKARHILVETQGAAMAIIDELDKGADFVELAKQKSTGPSGPGGGDLGWFTAERMVKPFSDAVAAMDDGSFTKEPVQTQFGWHVILREDSRDGTPPPLESVRDSIKQDIERNKFQEFMEDARANAED